jgi:hypothetical protein
VAKNGHDAKEAIARHLFEAIEQVRQDVAKVEFWADAVSGFSRPVPDYNPGQVNVWLPPEQASSLKPDHPGDDDSA